MDPERRKLMRELAQAQELDPGRKMVMSDLVRDYRLVADQELFKPVILEKKEAYCVPNGRAIVEGLTPMLRLGRNPELCLLASEEVYRLVALELGVATRISGRIAAVDGDVMVIHVSFVPSSNLAAHYLCYYLVFDAAAKSLFLLPPGPKSCLCDETKPPLKIPEDDGNYSLALLAERSHTEPVVAMWSPPDGYRRRDGRGTGAWVVKDRVPSNAAVWAVPFEAHVAFSCNGNAVWGDLAQGILYCRCRDLTDGLGPVEFKHKMLPEECITAYNKDDPDQVPVDKLRNMACVGDSIRFVVIQPSESSPADTEVKVWTLDLRSASKGWNLLADFTMKTIYEQDRPTPRRQRLPQEEGVVPLYPFFRPKEDRSLFMLLREHYRGFGAVVHAHLLCIDLLPEVRLRRRSQLEWPVMELPVVLHPLFFGPLAAGVQFGASPCL